MKLISVFGCCILVCSYASTVMGITYQDFTYRRASVGDLASVLMVMNDIEQSEAHQFIPLCPYAMRARYVEDLIANKALFVATTPEEIVSLVAVKLVPWPVITEYIAPLQYEDRGTMAYGPHDIFVVSELWYTAPHCRKHGVFTTLLGFALQSLVPRLKSLIQTQSLRVHFIADFITAGQQEKLNKKLIVLSKSLFKEYAESVRETYFPTSMHDVVYEQRSCDIAKPFYNPFVHDLEVAITRPAKRIVLSAIVQ